MPGTTSVLAPAVASTGFRRLYPERDGITIGSAPYAAIVTAPSVLATTLPAGTVEMKGNEGIDIIFCGTGSDNDDFNFEIYYYYLIAALSGETADRMYLPILAISSATGANANELSTFVGVDTEYIENELRFANVIAGITKSAFQTHLEATLDVSGNVNVYSPGSGVELPGMISIRNVMGAHAVRVHVYETSGAGQATTMQVLIRMTRGLNP